MTLIGYKVSDDRRRLPCRYHNWLQSEKILLTNGCGGKGGWFNPPEYRFHASCNHHDANYWLGGTEADREKADRQFLEALLDDAGMARRWWRRLWLRGAAWRYYWAVRWAGGKFFHYGKERGWDELEAEMVKASSHTN